MVLLGCGKQISNFVGRKELPLSEEFNSNSPRIVGLTTLNESGYFRANSEIVFYVHYDKPVIVMGQPVLELNVYPTLRFAEFAGGSGSTKLVFRYVVQTGDSANFLDISTSKSLKMLNGKIYSLEIANTPARLELPIPGLGDTVFPGKKLVIKTTPPPPPTAFTLVNPQASIANVKSPTVQIVGTSLGDQITLFDDSNCATNKKINTWDSEERNTTILIDHGNITEGAHSIYAQITDPAGNISDCSQAYLDYTLDTQPPEILAVTTTNPDGVLKFGNVSIQITASENIKITGGVGVPKLSLNTIPFRQAQFISVGGNNLTFNYSISSKDSTSHLNYASTRSLQMGGLQITDLAGNSLKLELPSTAGPDSLAGQSQIAINTSTAPTSVALISPSTQPSNNTLPSFRVSGVSPGSQVNLYKDSNCLYSYSDDTLVPIGSNSVDIVLKTPLNTGQESINYFYARSYEPTSGSVSPCSTANAVYEFDSKAPTVISVSSSAQDGIYSVGDHIPITVTFSETVNVLGEPTIRLSTGGFGEARYQSGSGSTKLEFSYIVEKGHVSNDLEYLNTSSLLVSNGASIQDLAGNNANLGLPGIGTANSLGGSRNLIINPTIPFAPTAITLLSAPPPNVNLTPTFQVSGGLAAGDGIEIYSDALCQNLLGSTIATSSTANITILPALSPLMNYTLYAKQVRAMVRQAQSPCSAALQTYSTYLPVQFDQVYQRVQEGSGSQSISMSIPIPIAQDVDITFNSVGTTAPGTLYSLDIPNVSGKATVRIPAGQTSVSIPFTILNNGAQDGESFIQLSISEISPSSIYSLDSSNQTRIYIEDDDIVVSAPKCLDDRA